MTDMKTVILDGAMGTMLQAYGLGPGERPELFAMKNPAAVEDIQRDYVKAGSKVLYSNTFGANRRKLDGTGYSVPQVIETNIGIARRAASTGNDVLVALDVGPIGEMMKPLGTLSFDDAYDIFREIVMSGERSGADIMVFETFTDLQEARAAVLAAKENTSLPVWVTMSFEKDGRTFTGTTVPCMAVTLGGLGVDALGINCSLGPDEILPMIAEMRQWTDLPLIAKPNAGLPDPATGMYFITPDQFAASMKPFVEMGVHAVGGCCGTSPAFIKALSEMASHTASVQTGAGNRRKGICSSSQMAEYGKVRLIGERINPTGKKRLKQALMEHDMDYIMKLAIEQADAGADILDINVGIPDTDEAAAMAEVVQAVQSVVRLPLMIDASGADAIEAGLRHANGKAIINSVNATDSRLAEILPLARKYGAAVLGLTMERKLPTTVEERIGHAMKIADTAVSYGIDRDDIIIDCLTLTVSAQQDQALRTLEAVRQVRQDLGLHAALGVSNIAFGLPERTHVTQAFLTMALHNGLDFPIINVNSPSVMDAVASYRALSGDDPGCTQYIERFAAAPSITQNAEKIAKNDNMSLDEAIIKGLGQETENAVARLLETMDALDIVNSRLIPALDEVGEKYARHEIFLPQLINAANAAGRGFDLIRKNLPRRSDASKGKIIIATVEGDIHDIGKNIVKVVLENYGYNVIDLGKDVPVQTVVDRTIAEDARLVALSALMTTTVGSMKRTIGALRQSGHECKVMVGGAVLTAEFAQQIGADFYARDPKESADIARRVLGE